MSLHNRVLFETPPFKANVSMLNRVADDIARLIGPANPLSYEEAFKHFPLSKRSRYLREIPKAEVGLRRGHATIRAFVKFERLNEWDKDPRMIQFRHPAYSLVLATFLKAVEHKLYRIKGGRFLPRSRCIAKGLNQRERYTLLAEKWLGFKNPCAFSIDASRWDVHVKRAMLKVEHRVYNMIFKDPLLRTLLEWQLKNTGFTATEIRYVVEGGRMSGDMNTALGNCILVIILVSAILRGVHFDMVDDGDDCIVICEADDMERISHMLVGGFLAHGFVLKIENVAFELQDIFFCNSKPCFDGVGWKFVRDPHKILGFGVAGNKFIKLGPKAFKGHLLSVGMCELALNVGVPCIQAYACRLLELGKGGKLTEGSVINVARLSMAKNEVGVKDIAGLKKVKPREITFEARESFERAFGISIAHQLAIEGSMDSVKFQDFSGVIVEDLAMWV